MSNSKTPSIGSLLFNKRTKQIYILLSNEYSNVIDIWVPIKGVEFQTVDFAWFEASLVNGSLLSLYDPSL